MKTLRLPKLDVRKDRAKILGGLSLLIGLNLLVFLGVILPRNRELGNLGEEIRRGEEEIRQREKIVAGHQELLDGASAMRNRLDHFLGDRLSSKGARMTSILREVRRLAGSLRIDAETIQYRHKFLEDRNLVQFEMSVPLVGTYSSLRQFLQKVEGSEHFLIIDEIGLSGSKEGGARLSLNIRLATYFSGDETLEVVRPITGEDKT